MLPSADCSQGFLSEESDFATCTMMVDQECRNSTLCGTVRIFNESEVNYGFNNTTVDVRLFLESSDGSVLMSSPMFAYPIAHLVVISTLIGFLILLTIIGNVFVISAILLEKSLRTEQNYLILSLAITDLMVAVLVMPLSLLNEVSSGWYLGDRICDMWICFDVLCCTSSILHLVAIACDRYMAVTRIDYIRQRNWQRICVMVVVVWVISAGVSIPPLFGWKDNSKTPEITGLCVISQDLGYTVFSTGAAFYFPMFLIVGLNYKIYTTAKWRIEKRRTLKGSFHHSDTKAADDLKDSKKTETRDTAKTNGDIQTESDNKLLESGSLNAVTQIGSQTVSPIAVLLKAHFMKYSQSSKVPAVTPEEWSHSPTEQCAPRHNGLLERSISTRRRQRQRDSLKRQRSELRREKKAARVLGIITVAFIMCWLPFFILAVLGPFCGSHCNIPIPLISVFLWLGYFNSFLNPVIYTVFNHHFRIAFNKMFSGDLCKRKQFPSF